MLTITRSGRLAEIWWSVCISKSHRRLCLIFLEGFLVVHIPFVRMVKFKFLAQLTVNHPSHPVVGVNFGELILMLYSHDTTIRIYIYIYIYGNKINNNDERTHFFRKNIPLTLHSKGLRKGYVWEVSWRRNRLQHIDPPVPLTIAALLFSFCWAAQPEVLRAKALCMELVLAALNWN